MLPRTCFSVLIFASEGAMKGPLKVIFNGKKQKFVSVEDKIKTEKNLNQQAIG